MKKIILMISLFIFNSFPSYSQNTSDFDTVLCFRTSEYDKKPVLYTCNKPMCSSGYSNKIKNHKYCDSDNYMDVKHRFFGSGQVYVLCTQLFGWGGPGNDKCKKPLN